MTRSDVRFDPEMRVVGAEGIPRGGSLVVSAHFRLNILITRWLHDRGETMTAFVADVTLETTYAGLDARLRKIGRREPVSLVKVRSVLRQGSKVFAELDSTIFAEERLRVETPAGARYVYADLIHLAVRMGVPVVFSAVHFDDDDQVVLTLHRPAGSDVPRIMDEFSEFFRGRAEAMRR